MYGYLMESSLTFMLYHCLCICVVQVSPRHRSQRSTRSSTRSRQVVQEELLESRGRPLMSARSTQFSREEEWEQLRTRETSKAQNVAKVVAFLVKGEVQHGISFPINLAVAETTGLDDLPQWKTHQRRGDEREREGRERIERSRPGSAGLPIHMPFVDTGQPLARIHESPGGGVGTTTTRLPHLKSPLALGRSTRVLEQHARELTSPGLGAWRAEQEESPSLEELCSSTTVTPRDSSLQFLIM